MIKVGMCIAYDWEKLYTSLPRVYSTADIIYLSIDKNRRAWSGTIYQFDDNHFYSFIEKIDLNKKIVIYEDDFSLPQLTSRENAHRQRHLLGEKMGEGGWHIQIDVDEYFLNFPGFVSYLKKFSDNPTSRQKPINICCPIIPLLKKLPSGYLYVTHKNKHPEFFPFATNKPDYLEGERQNGYFNHLTSYYVLHETWARSDDELWFKINNWAHVSDHFKYIEQRESYYNLWKSIDQYNHHYIHNIHPIAPHIWPSLNFHPSNNIEDLIKTIPIPTFPLSKVELFLKNNRNVARIIHLKNKLLGMK